MKVLFVYSLRGGLTFKHPLRSLADIPIAADHLFFMRLLPLWHALRGMKQRNAG